VTANSKHRSACIFWN